VTGPRDGLVAALGAVEGLEQVLHHLREHPGRSPLVAPTPECDAIAIREAERLLGLAWAEVESALDAICSAAPLDGFRVQLFRLKLRHDPHAIAPE
jgi:hypothetical protein